MWSRLCGIAQTVRLNAKSARYTETGQPPFGTTMIHQMKPAYFTGNPAYSIPAYCPKLHPPAG